MQEDKESSEHQPKHVNIVADKTGNRKAVDDKGKESNLRKSKYGSFDARCMKIKSGSRYFGNPGNQLIFADPKQTDDISKSRNNENRSVRNSGVNADDATNVLCQLLKQ